MGEIPKSAWRPQAGEPLRAIRGNAAALMEAGISPEDLPGLLRRCRGIDEDAWAEFLPWFRRVAKRVLGRFSNLTLAEREEAQDRALANVVTDIKNDGISGTTPWEILVFVRTVVTNCARDVWRQRRPAEPLPPLLREGGPGPARQAEVRRQLDCARAMIASWAPQDQFVFLMKLEHVPTAAIKDDLERL